MASRGARVDAAPCDVARSEGAGAPHPHPRSDRPSEGAPGGREGARVRVLWEFPTIESCAPRGPIPPMPRHGGAPKDLAPPNAGESGIDLVRTHPKRSAKAHPANYPLAG